MKDDILHINITAGTIVKVILFAALVGVLYHLSDLVLVLLTSVVIASAIEPLTKWLMDRRLPRVVAVVLIYLGAFLVLTGVLYFFLPPLVDNLVELSARVPGYLDSFVSADATGGFASIVRSFKASFTRSFSILDVIPGIQQALTGISGGFLETAQFLFASLFSLVILIVISFYLAVQETGVEDFIRLVSPIKYEDYIVGLWMRSRRKIGLWMQGQALLGLLIGVFAFLGLSIFGVRYALVFAILAFLFELIPVFGPVLAAVLPTVTAFTQSIPLGFLVLGFFIIIQQFENHLIYPLVVRKIVGVPPLLVILALIVGARLAGVWGIILAVPASAIVMEIVSDIEKRKRPAIP